MVARAVAEDRWCVELDVDFAVSGDFAVRSKGTCGILVRKFEQLI